MALTGKTVSIKYIIEKVQDSYGFLKDTDVYSVAEHIFDAMGLIGVANAYVRKQTDGVGSNPDIIDIVDHRGEMPCDLFEVISCKEGENNYPMIEDTSTFRQHWNDDDNSDNFNHPITYNIEGVYIYTKFKTGKVIVEYLAFPTDDDGLPTIPDNTRYIKAIIAYVAERVAFKLWMQDKLSREKYQHIEREWLFYVGSAKTSAMMPGVDKLEAFKNQMARMTSNEHHHSNHFKFRSNPEALKIK